MRDLGAVFREFREAGNFSLKDVTKFLALLEQIHVPVASFLDKARDFRHEERIKLMSQINQLYYANDVAGFQKLQAEEEAKAEKSSNPLYYELNVILLQGLICQRNPQYSMEQADLDHV